jgi:hypothetical protein
MKARIRIRNTASKGLTRSRKARNSSIVMKKKKLNGASIKFKWLINQAQLSHISIKFRRQKKGYSLIPVNSF